MNAGLLVEATNRQAEMSVLSCIFQEPNLIYLSQIKAEYFFDPLLARIYGAMGKAVSDSKKIDVPIVSHYLDDVDPQELWDIYAYASITADFTDNCNILLENYNRRNIQKQAQKVAILSSDTSFEYMSLIAEASKVADVEEIETTNQLLP